MFIVVLQQKEGKVAPIYLCASHWVLAPVLGAYGARRLPRAQLRESLSRCNAFQEDLHSYKLLFPTAKLVD